MQFYLAYLEHIARFRPAGLPFCSPTSRDSQRMSAPPTPSTWPWRASSSRDGDAVVVQRLPPDDPERILVVTGPNQGGKTTFARTFGQLHHLAGLGSARPRRAGAALPARPALHPLRAGRGHRDPARQARGRARADPRRSSSRPPASSIIDHERELHLDHAPRRAVPRHGGDAADRRAGRAGRVRDVRRRAGLARARRRSAWSARSCPTTRRCGRSGRQQAGRRPRLRVGDRREVRPHLRAPEGAHRA